MSNALEQLVGQRVTFAKNVEDYAQLIFEHVGLTIYNKYTVSGGGNLSELIGLFLENVSENDGEIVLIFNTGIAFRVDFRPNAYHGPEAMVLHREGQPTVVWN